MDAAPHCFLRRPFALSPNNLTHISSLLCSFLLLLESEVQKSCELTPPTPAGFLQRAEEGAQLPPQQSKQELTHLCRAHLPKGFGPLCQPAFTCLMPTKSLLFQTQRGPRRMADHSCKNAKKQSAVNFQLDEREPIQPGNLN